VVGNAAGVARAGYPVQPSATWLLAGAVAGALLALVPAGLPRPLRRLRPGAVGAGGLAAVAGAALAWAGDGYVERHARTGWTFDAGASGFLSRQARFRSGSQPVMAADAPIGVLAGDRLRHRVRLLPADASCRRVQAAVREGWLTIPRQRFPQLARASTAPRCLAGARPVYADGHVLVYGRAGED
jgi:hypothetical protein